MKKNNVASSLKQSPLNFKITDDNHGVGGAKSKYNLNVAAIKLLKQIESENRLATSQEQQALSKYAGWGEIPEVFDKDKTEWRKEYEELKSLLSDDEYRAARASTLDSHYTPPTVIKAIYGALQKMGFSKGNILEPSMGTGNFFGLLPEGMKESKLYGVELDSVTGRIAKQLYQDADITVAGYEKTSFPDNFFDVAVGNVPFGDYRVQDNRYDKYNFRIHDYFFAKTLDKVRPGGVIAFITSKGTMDKSNPAVRRYLAQRAELLGAIRLPNNAFMANAGTEVTADILFLQKRERMIDRDQDWVHLNSMGKRIPVNSYFANNPSMMLGNMVMKSMYGRDTETACIPIGGSPLSEQLEKAVGKILGKIVGVAQNIDLPDNSIPADPNVQNFSYAIMDGELYFRENSIMTKTKKSREAARRAIGLTEIRDCVKTLINYQLNDFGDEEIAAKQVELNDLYDDFTSKFGLINNKYNEAAYTGDSSYQLLCSLENEDEQKQVHKADIFNKRTIKRKWAITSVDTAVEALTVSIAEKGRVDIPYMSSLTGSDNEQIISELEGIMFQNPEKRQDDDKFAGYETADEYLSGNIREKLKIARQAAKDDSSYNVNVRALEAAMPKELTAVEIDARLGAMWISPEHVNEFMNDLLEPPLRNRKDEVVMDYNSTTEKWSTYGDTWFPNNTRANVTYGTSRINAYRIIEDTLNLQDVRIYDTVVDVDGKKRRVLNKNDTTLAQQKQELIRQEFKDWVFKDPKRRDELVQKYNEQFNSTKPREYDGGHFAFSGINNDIKLHKHQLNGIARVMYGGNSLLAHVVGAGKTYTMIAAAMESKRLGLCQKSLFVVPNHLTEQTASEFVRLYPAANILVATADMFKTKNRKKFCSRIATGDYDAVIIGHSQFEKIPISEKRKLKIMREQIDEIFDGTYNFNSIKKLERSKKYIEARLSILNKTERKDDVVTFEELGIDRIFIDEAHYYKNLYLVTKMHNVAGIPQNEAQKSSDLLMKCRYMDELTGRKGTVFATGTPVSNSMAELYTMMRYLQHDALQKHGLGSFDSWASTFGETVSSLELAPEGTGYRSRTRFAKFYNLPELMSIFKEVADIQTADMLNLSVPKANYHVVVAKPSEYQKDMIGVLSGRADAIHEGRIRLYEDNMLKITLDGRKIGLDQRLMNSTLPDYEDSKVNMCARNIYEIWENTKEDKLTQLMFCDFSTPKRDGAFNIYDDIKNKLVQKGIPEDEIAYIHDVNTEKRKDELFEKVRKGQVRVLMGSTAKMGMGTNVQDKLIALHDLDCPWKPAELEQREGRIIRQGNKNPLVNIYRYVTESTFDAYLYQTIENKQKFISQIMTSKNPLRSCEDADEKVLSYAEIKALCTGDERIREKINLDIDVARLRILKSGYQSNLYSMEDELNKTLPKEIGRSRNHISNYEADIVQVNSTKSKEFSTMVVMGNIFVGKDEKTKAGEAITSICTKRENNVGMNNMEIGKYRGFIMLLSYSAFDNEYTLTLKNNGIYNVTLGESAIGNITRIENALYGIAEKLDNEKERLDTLLKQAENIKDELKKPFSHEKELAAKSARLNELNIQLNLDNSQNDNVGLDIDERDNAVPKKENSLDYETRKEMKNVIQEAKKILGLNAIIINAAPNIAHKGKIVALSENYAIQEKIGKSGIIHELKELKERGNLAINEEVTIKYDKKRQGEILESVFERSKSEELEL